METSKSSGLLHIYKRLIVFIKPYKITVFLFLLVSFINIFINLSEGYLLKNIVDSAINKQLSVIRVYILATIAIIVIGMVVSYLLQYLYGYFNSNAMKDFRLYLYKHFQKLPVKCFETEHSGDLLSRFANDVSSVQNFFGSDIITLFLDFLLFIAAFTYLSIINWKLLLFSIMLSPLSILAILFLSGYIQKYSYQNQEFLGKASAVVQDAVSGISIIKSFNLKKQVLNRYEREIYKSWKSTRNIIRISIYMMPIQVVLRMVPSVLCISYGGYLAIKGWLTPGELMAFIYLLQYVSMPLALLTEKIGLLKNAEGAIKRVVDVLDWPLECESGDGIKDSVSNIAIELKNVIFGYNEDTSIINNLNLSIEKGKKIAVVGKSGCGKSSLLKLICGFHTPNTGEIEVNGQNIKKSKVADVRNLISLVTQDTYFFPVSVMENISYGLSGASFDDVIHAAKAANAYDFIMALPEGFQTMVGERGVKLSGGQKQRLALARAVLKNAPILLLDEPTSALDTASEALVQEDLDRIIQDKTVIMIAHRFSTIKNADKIIVMENGTIVESGTHDELLCLNGSYSQLYEKQFIKR